MIFLLEIAQYLTTFLAACSLVVALWNNRFLNRLSEIDGNRPFNLSSSKVSVLIPARNEATRINECITKLLEQDHSNIEIIILDDRSTDRTVELVECWARKDKRIVVVKGNDLPAGWVGKHWACHQLAHMAKGDHFLFVDADTVIASKTITHALIESSERDSDLLTVIPSRTINCVIEKLIYSFIDWAIFCWLPLKIAHSRDNAYLSATFGQFMLFKREAYFKTGGHEAIKDNAIDDFELGRMIKRLGLKWVLTDGSGMVRSLSYGGNIAAFRGISRSVFPALNYRLSVLASMSFLLGICGFLPVSTLIARVVFGVVETQFVMYSALSLSLFSLSWLIVCKRFGHSLFALLVYPISIAVMLIMAYYSMLANAFTFATWKGRDIEGRRLRL